MRCECEGRQCDVNVTGVNVTIHNYDLYIQTTQLIHTSQCRLLQAQDAALTHLQAPYTHTTVTNKHIQLFLILYKTTSYTQQMPYSRPPKHPLYTQRRTIHTTALYNDEHHHHHHHHHHHYQSSSSSSIIIIICCAYSSSLCI